MTVATSRRPALWVVDDSTTDAERVRRVLEGEYEVDILHDGAAALERLASGDIPDLLLLDWIMPGISGIDVCRYVRASGGKFPAIPILLLTARHSPREIIEAFHSGANDYVVKPFVEEELRARVRSLIQGGELLRRAEQAEADVRMLLENAPDPMLAVDAQGRITFANREALRVLGLSSAEVVGAPVKERIAGLSLLQVTAAPGESLLPLPDVQIGARIFSPSIRVLPSDDAGATTVALREVTDRRRAEARRLDFYSIIAHDLRTPITSALLRLQLALRGKHGVLPTGLIQELRQMESSLRSQLGMINDFLELARFEGVGYKIDRIPVDVCEVVRATVADFQPLIEKSRLELKVDEPRSGLCRVMGDRQRLAQVVANLVGNAIKFTPPCGRITLGVQNNGEHVEISVEDTGRGIPAEDIPQLFDRFTSASDLSSDTPGTGLGLMIVREVVEAHHGVIGVESQPGVGSRFWFRLPSIPEQPHGL